MDFPNGGDMRELPEETRTIIKQRLSEAIGESQRRFAATVLGDAKQAGTVSTWLNPENPTLPRAEHLRAIADATGYSVDWLLGRSEAADRDGPLSLSAARQVVLESTVEWLMKDAEVQARHREPATVSQKALCKHVALEAVVRVFRTPALVQRAREAYLEAFDSWLRDEERLELHRLRREARRRRSSAGGTTIGTTKARQLPKTRKK
jgi:transcriptional regulator with XRE-family HTH domain